MLPDGARQLAEPYGLPQADGVKRSSPGLPKDHLRGEIVHPSLGILAFMRPMPPKLIILHKLRMLAIDMFALGTAHDIGIQHAALNREPTFREVLPGMPLRDG